jgi:hypothetical protein
MRQNESVSTASSRRWILHVSIALGLIGAGAAFCYKIAEFLFTLNSEEVRGFADVPVTVYFAVAAGWLALLVWSFLTGKLTEAEQTKCDLIRMEEEYDRLGQ